MLLELMSDGTLAELPPENIPDNLATPDEPSVMLLLPHNKYLLGTASKWVFASANDVENHEDVFLYDDQNLSLSNENSRPTVLTKEIVNALRRELFSLTEPPGRHIPTALMLRTFSQLREHNILDFNVLDEKLFSEAMKDDLILYKSYWAVRFSLSRNEIGIARRLKAWLDSDPKIFEDSRNVMKIWFSITDKPAKNIMSEIEELSFTKIDINQMAAQQFSPIILYNPKSGWLIMNRFSSRSGKTETPMFTVWVYLNHELYREMKEIKQMKIQDIIFASWGEYETQQAIKERAKYKGDD